MRQLVAWYKNFLAYHAMTLRIPLVAAKILLVAMPRRNQWKKNSVGRSKNSVGRDELQRPSS
jgi:hypothetical protein